MIKKPKGSGKMKIGGWEKEIKLVVCKSAQRETREEGVDPGLGWGHRRVPLEREGQ